MGKEVHSSYDACCDCDVLGRQFACLVKGGKLGQGSARALLNNLDTQWRCGDPAVLHSRAVLWFPVRASIYGRQSTGVNRQWASTSIRHTAYRHIYSVSFLSVLGINKVNHQASRGKVQACKGVNLRASMDNLQWARASILSCAFYV